MNEFRGKDRDILTAFDIRTDMIRQRDALAAAGSLRPSLSTMEAIIDPENIEVNQALTNLQNHCKVLLAKTRV